MPESESWQGFEWVDNEELTPEVEGLLAELSVPSRRMRSTREMPEVVQTDLAVEVQDRLQALRVENFELFDRKLVKDIPELQMTPNILDDVHYVVYRGLKQMPFARFVSVNAQQIYLEFRNMASTGVNGVILQREQNKNAIEILTGAGKIEEGSLYEAMSSSNGRLAVRSLHRLLAEDSMSPFTKILPKAHRRRSSESPLLFDEVGARAFHFLDMKLRQHARLDVSQFSTDQRISYNLVGRDLGRARAFAEPVNNYIAENLPPEK
jgi:hypothetical protein